MDERAPTPTHQGPEAVDGLVEHLDYPLFVVTAADGEERSGCLAGFVTQCSIDPPRFLVCVSRANHTFEVAHRSAGLGLHLLGRDQRAVAAHFGEETGDQVDKFADCAWQPGETGVPILAESAAWIEGRVVDELNVGDHDALVIEPLQGDRGTHPGQLTYRDVPDLEPGHPAHTR